jgi:aspartate beta-hydroxylase
MAAVPAQADVIARQRLADSLWDRVQTRWPSHDLKRVRDALAIWSYREPPVPHPKQEANGFYIPGLPYEPWIDPGAFPFTDIVREAFPDMRREASRFIDGTMAAPHYGLPDDASADTPPTPGRPSGWLEWRFVSRGALIGPRCKEFPATAEVARQIVNQWTIRNIIFMILVPGTRLKPHHDFTNAFANLWLGLIVPEGCGLRVAGETRVPEEGGCLAFDHTYEHWSWNDSAKTRIVFSVAALHPRLAPIEREIAAFLLPHLEGYVSP